MPIKPTYEELEEEVAMYKRLLQPEVFFPTSWRLTPKQTQILRLLIERSRFSRDMAIMSIYGAEDYAVDGRIVDVMVGRIRSAFKTHKIPIAIDTEWGYGYRISEEHRTLLRQYAGLT